MLQLPHLFTNAFTILKITNDSNKLTKYTGSIIFHTAMHDRHTFTVSFLKIYFSWEYTLQQYFHNF